MSDLTRDWLKAFGRPKPSAPSGLVFQPGTTRALWADIAKTIGAGYLMDGFLYLFGEGLEDLQACLKVWSFAVPPATGTRTILGRNAYGAILYIDNAERQLGSVYCVDPTVPHVYHSAGLDFLSLLGDWLPNGRLNYFLDDSAYKKWRKQTTQTLEPNQVLAMKIPRGLGGEMDDLDNFNVEDIRSFYETSAPIHKEALAAMVSGGGKKPGAKKTAAKKKK